MFLRVKGEVQLEKWIHNRTLYEGPIIRLRVGEVEIDDGSHHGREVVDHNGGVAVVPFLGDRVILVRQFRIAIEEDILELPAGRLEGDEDVEYRVRQELEEEVGYRPGRLVHVSSCYCSPGFTNELDHIYLAFDLTPCERRPEPDENIELVELTLDEVRSMLDKHEFIDAKTIIGLRELLVHLQDDGR